MEIRRSRSGSPQLPSLLWDLDCFSESSGALNATNKVEIGRSRSGSPQLPSLLWDLDCFQKVWNSVLELLSRSARNFNASLRSTEFSLVDLVQNESGIDFWSENWEQTQFQFQKPQKKARAVKERRDCAKRRRQTYTALYEFSRGGLEVWIWNSLFYLPAAPLSDVVAIWKESPAYSKIARGMLQKSSFSAPFSYFCRVCLSISKTLVVLTFFLNRPYSGYFDLQEDWRERSKKKCSRADFRGHRRPRGGKKVRTPMERRFTHCLIPFLVRNYNRKWVVVIFEWNEFQFRKLDVLQQK